MGRLITVEYFYSKPLQVTIPHDKKAPQSPLKLSNSWPASGGGQLNFLQSSPLT